MSGHSHWAGIKHKKGAVDAKRGKLFSKIAKQIIVAARAGGGDVNANLTLKYAIDKARQANMTKDSIERAIKKGTGELAGGDLVNLVYEGFGPGGVAVIAEALTDNRNRTASEIRKVFETRGARLGGPNEVSWMFDKKGLVSVEEDKIDEDTLMEIAIEAGAEEMEKVGSVFEITCEPSDFEGLKQALDEKGIPTQAAELTLIPQNVVELDEKTGRKVLTLMEALEEHDDIQNVHANFRLPEALLMEQTGG